MQSVRVRFHGGPLDGQAREIPATTSRAGHAQPPETYQFDELDEALEVEGPTHCYALRRGSRYGPEYDYLGMEE